MRVADAARGAGRDQVARLELDDLRDVGDERRDVEDEVADRAALAQLAVDGRRQLARRRGPASSSSVTTSGPTGVEACHDFPANHCSERYWKSRIETSFISVTPATWSSASTARDPPAAAADHRHQLALVVDLRRLGRDDDGLVRDRSAPARA